MVEVEALPDQQTEAPPSKQGPTSETLRPKIRPNNEVWETLQRDLYTLDDDHDLPSWCILYDDRLSTEAEENRQKKEVETMDLIDRIFDQMITDGLPNLYSDTPKHPGIDDELRTIAKNLILFIQRTRWEQRIPPYTPEAILTVAYEVWHVDYLHRNHHRDTGELYSRTHLPETALNVIRSAGLTGLATVIAALHHEDPEDLTGIHIDPKPEQHAKSPERYIDPSKLLCAHQYGWAALTDQKTSRGEIGKMVQKTSIQVTGLTRGVTKARYEFREQVGAEGEEVHNIRVLIREALRHGFRVIALKSADALHNIDTLGGMAPDKATKKPKKIRRAVHVFTPLDTIARFDRMAGELLEASFRYQNPGAIERFETIRETRLQQYLGEEKGCSHLNNLLTPLRNCPDIEYIAIRPRRFRDYADPEQIENPDYTPFVDWTDPMFEIYVQVRSPEKIEGNILEENEERLKKIDRVRTAILEQLKAPLGEGTEDRGYDSLKGGFVHIINRQLFPKKETTAQLTIRIHDAPTEARNRRGYLGKRTQREKEEEMPPVIRSAMQTVVARTRNVTDRTKLIHLLRKELLKTPITEFTPEGELIELPGGATALDFATKIHTSVLRNCIGVVLRKSIGDTKGARPASYNPLDPLPPGMVVNIVTRRTDPDFNLLQQPLSLDLGWLNFANSYTQERLRSILANIPEEKSQEKKDTIYVEKGTAFLKRLANLYNLNINNLTRTLLISTGDEGAVRQVEKTRKALAPRKRQEPIEGIEKKIEEAQKILENRQRNLLRRIGKGEINPLEILAQEENDTLMELTHTEISLEFPDLPNIPGELEKISAQMRKNGMNISTIETTLPVLQLTISPTEGTNLYEVLKFILRLQYFYPSVRVTSTTFYELLDTKAQTGKQQLLDFGTKIK